MVSNKYTHKETGEIKLAINYNPKIITDNLVLCLDAAEVQQNFLAMRARFGI
jgi:hypothetical protein